MPGWDLSLVLPTITQHAVQFIRQRAARADKPFFLYLPLTAPHTPIAPSPHFIGKSGAGWYGDYVCEVDWTVGQVLAALERNNLSNTTLVIFTSDNGSPQRDGSHMNGAVGSVKTHFGHDPSRPWRGLKADIWEGGHRVPLVAVWPGHVPAGGVSDEPIILTDLMRTLATLTEFELPDGAAPDSCDFSAVLRGQSAGKPVHDFLVHHSGNGVFAIRQGHWKLILGRGSGGFTKYSPPADAPAGQLYNLNDDPHEQRNVYAQHPDIVERLTATLRQVQTQDSPKR